MLSVDASRKQITDALVVYDNSPRSSTVYIAFPNAEGAVVVGNAGDLCAYLKKLAGELLAGGQEALLRRLRDIADLPDTSTIIKNTKIKQRIVIEQILYGGVRAKLVALQPLECVGPGCVQKDDDGNLKSCSTCRCVKYCSKACQKRHWKDARGHKGVCAALAEATADVSKNGVQNAGLAASTTKAMAEFTRNDLYALSQLSPSLRTLFKAQQGL